MSYACYIVNTTPLLKDLYQHITPQYATEWKVIGTLLDLPSGELKAIEAGYPTNVKWCCNQMLEKWLEVDTTASWKKLLIVIESSAVSCSATDKGEYAVASYVTSYNIMQLASGISTDYVYYAVFANYSYPSDLHTGPSEYH